MGAKAKTPCKPVSVGIKGREVVTTYTLTDDELVASQRLPTDNPPFTIGDLKNAIPPHCFEKSTLISMGYTVADLAGVALLYFLSTFIDTPLVPAPLAYILWPLYWFAQGVVCTGLWVTAHECGHRAFSNSVLVCDTVGLILHTALLVPYHSWRISHRKHHARTNSIEEDEVFIPYTRSEMEGSTNPHEQSHVLSGVVRFISIVKMLVFGWPTYLIAHVTGRKYGSRTNHFEPNSPIFAPSEYWMIVLSDVALVAWGALLCYLASANGVAWLFKVYVVPYLWVNFWLVLYTHLQHTDPKLPHYRKEQWTWLKGALCSLDRDYGVFNYFHHHIGDTHVVHHLFSYLPHYHAQEATRALKPLLKNYYIVDDVKPGLLGVLSALWKTTTWCRFVEDKGDILWLKWQ